MQTSTPEEHHPLWMRTAKIFLAVMVCLVAAILGYLVVYWWVFGGLTGSLDVSVLRSQVVSQQRKGDVHEQLMDLGFSVSREDLNQLKNPQSTNYRADVLGGFEPEKLQDDEAVDDAYYFYDENGQPYFFVVDENNEIDPDAIMPLIAH